MYSLSHIARPISGYEIARLQPRNASHTGDPTTRFLYRLASRLLYRLTQPATNPRGQFRLNISTFKPIFSQMNNLTQGYSLGVRLAHISATIVLLLLFATGARLAWFDQGFFSHEVSNLVDWLAPTGRVVLFHVVLGITFVAIGMFYLACLFLNKEAPRLFGLFLDRRYSFTKKIFYLLSLAVGLTSFLTGVTLYCGLYVGPDGYTFMKYLHYYCSLFLMGFVIVHIFDVVTSRCSKVNSIFFGARHAGFADGKVLGLSAVLAVMFALVAFALINRAPTLVCKEQNRFITVDGHEHEIEWTGTDSLVVETAGGVNFAGGNTRVTIKTFHDGQQIYFLVRWTDRTRSYNRHLVKTKEGWKEELSEYIDIFGESIYSEDKIALSFRKRKGGCLTTCHLRTPGKMGLHATSGDTVDVWQWMAVSTNPAWEADDRWWGAYENDVTGGRHCDNIASGGYKSNLNEQWQQPYFLPQHVAMRHWIWFGSSDYVPYHPDLDTFAIGSRVPSILVAPVTGDRGDVTARGVWRNGVWTVEFARRLSTGSPFDVVFRGELYLGVAPFDNADSKHAYHLRPIRLVVE